MSFEVSIRVVAPLQQVWGAWISAESAQGWLAPRANISFEEGGAYELFWDEDPEKDSTLGCRLLKIEPLTRLVFEWQGKTEFLPLFEPPNERTEVEVLFEGSDDGVTVVLKEKESRDLEGWDEYQAWMAHAWEYAFAQLKRHCEETKTR